MAEAQRIESAVEGEIVHDEKPAKSTRAIATRPDFQAPEAWAPSPLAELSNEEFDRRVAMAARERERIAIIQRSVMKLDTDFGVIPGTGKPTLFKPGAEVLNKMAGLSPRFTPHRMHGDSKTAPPIAVQVKCELLNRAGQVIAEGDGSANSWEVKYRYRNANRACPVCGAEAIIKGKEEYGGGWVCWKRKDGCGAEFEDEDPQIIGQAAKAENADPFDLDNTILKMAEKRAMIAATLIAHAASGIFAQDVEDLPESQRPAKVGVFDAFYAKGVKREQVAALLGHDSEEISSDERRMLAGVYHGMNTDGLSWEDSVAKYAPRQSEKLDAAGLNAIGEAAEKRLAEIGDESLSLTDIKNWLLQRFSVKMLEQIPAAELPTIVKELATWEPGVPAKPDQQQTDEAFAGGGKA